MERGTVKWFDGRDGKRYGFILLPSGEEIFFHFNDGELIQEGDTEPKFCDGAVSRAKVKPSFLNEAMVAEGRWHVLGDSPLITTEWRELSRREPNRAIPWSRESSWSDCTVILCVTTVPLSCGYARIPVQRSSRSCTTVCWSIKRPQ